MDGCHIGDKIALMLKDAAWVQDLSSLRATVRVRIIERGRIIGLKEADWANRRIARPMGRNDAAIRRCWQEWVGSGRFQRHNGSGLPRATAD
ncbi:HTH_Tnp_Tc3_2 domain-containing protein [Trichonephila clavipes]|nr:HTH_Tnp_Tc3_2 domain-containing protein [Trichonephila clavipes]